MNYVAHTTIESRAGHGKPLIIKTDAGRTHLASRTVLALGPSELVFRYRQASGIQRRHVFLQSAGPLILDETIPQSLINGAIIVGFLPGAIPRNNAHNRQAASEHDEPTLTVRRGGDRWFAHEVAFTGSAAIIHDPTLPRGEKSVIRTSSPVIAVTNPIDRTEVEIGVQ